MKQSRDRGVGNSEREVKVETHVTHSYIVCSRVLERSIS